MNDTLEVAKPITLDPESTKWLADRHPEQYALFVSNPPTSLQDYVIGFSCGKYKLANITDRTVQLTFPAEDNREIFFSHDMLYGRSTMDQTQATVLNFLWIGKEFTDGKHEK